jgi:hypothetical protein
MLTRRNMLQGGAAACLLTASGPVGASASWPAPLNPALLARARAELEHKRFFFQHSDLFAIADFSLPSGEERFHLIETASGRVTSYHVAHGRGSDPMHSGYVHQFSDEPGSKASSAGAYVTTEFYYGKYGKSLALKGLDWSNRHAEARAIVIHSAPYAEPEVLDRYGKLGRSEGCFALSGASHRAILERLGPGRMLYCDKLAAGGAA